MPILNAEATFKQVASDPDFGALPEPQKIEYLGNAVMPSLDPDFNTLQPVQKEEYIRNVVLPKVQPSNVQVNTQPAQRPQAQPGFRLPEMLTAPIQSAAKNYYDDLAYQALGIKAASGGYLDPTKGFEDTLNQEGLLPSLRRGYAEMVGTAVPFVAGEGLLNAGISQAASKLAPLTTSVAQAAGVTKPWMQTAYNAANFLQKNSLPARAIKDAAALAGYEGLKNQPNNQRLQSAGAGAAAGVALPYAFAGAGKVLQGGIKMLQDMVTPSQLPVSLKASAIQAIRKDLFKRYEQLADVYSRLKRGEIDSTLVDAEDYAELVTKMDELAQAIQAGKRVKNPENATRIARKLEGKAKIQAQKFIPSSDGSINHGNIPKEVVDDINQRLGTNFLPGYIRFEKSSKPHIDVNIKRLQGRGYTTTEEHVEFVAKNYDKIYRGEKGGFVIAVTKQGPEVSRISISPGRRYYRIDTTHPSTDKKLEKLELLWEKPQTAPQTSSGAGSNSQNLLNKTGSEARLANGQSNYSQDSTTQKASQPSPKLTGSVKEMVEQGLEGTGLSLDEARTLLGQVKTLGKEADDPRIQELTAKKKALGSKRDDATKEAKAKIDSEIQEIKAERKGLREQAGKINPNLREVLNTGWDGQSALAEQAPVEPEKQLLFGQVKELLIGDDLKKGELLAKAMEEGRSVRLKHQAEITGSTDAAVKITGKGNVVVADSTFTPTHFVKATKGDKEYVAVMGYTESGYMHRYYINSPEGSRIVKINKIMDTEAFVGPTPNAVLGQRKYKVADVLGRAPEGEAIKTSEALENAQAFANLFKSETIKQFSKPTQKVLRAAQKRGRFDEGTLKYIMKQIENNSDDLKAVCQLFNLKIGQ